jgi:hypothetical protein
VVPVLIKEKQKRVQHIPTKEELAEKKRYSFTSIPEYDYVYSGKLTFTIDSYRAKRKNWNDGDSGLLEKHMGEIIIAIMDTIDAERI